MAITYTDIYLNVYKQYLVYENSHTRHCNKRIYNYSFTEKQFPSRHVRFRSKEEIQEIIELKNFAGEEGGVLFKQNISLKGFVLKKKRSRHNKYSHETFNWNFTELNIQIDLWKSSKIWQNARTINIMKTIKTFSFELFSILLYFRIGLILYKVSMICKQYFRWYIEC